MAFNRGPIKLRKLLCVNFTPVHVTNIQNVFIRQSINIFQAGIRLSSSESADASDVDGEFRVLNLKRRIEKVRKERAKRHLKILPPRYLKMPVNQDWSNVWPAARTFNPSVVPLPIYQGYTAKKIPPGKFGNTELMKIPNFLHLTPPAIKKHCAAIKKFCTPWPKGLETDELCEKHFPVENISSDYCHSSASVRDYKARIVTLTVRLSSLQLDFHARDKLLRLIGNQYNPKTDVMTLVVERCPLRKQNYDYAQYLLTALYYESWKTEPWESEKSEADFEQYIWKESKSNRSIIDMAQFVEKLENVESPSQAVVWLLGIAKTPSPSDIVQDNLVSEYAEAVTKLHNEGENESSLNEYKSSVKKLLGLPEFVA